MGELFDGRPSDMLTVSKDKKVSIIDKFGDKPEKLQKEIVILKKKMKKSAENLEFEEAAKIRDEVKRLELLDLNMKSGLIEKESSTVE